MAHPNPQPRYRLVIFDMDGTLTQELLDFEAIRQEIGVPSAAGILEFITHLPPAEKHRAQELLHRHEFSAAQTCLLHEGAPELLAALRQHHIHTALLTRNSSACASTILGRHQLVLDFIATRDHLPHKPHPDSILNIVRHFATLPEQTLMVGDYLYDLQAAHNAGVDSALLCIRPGPPPAFASMATYVIRHLQDVLNLVIGNW